MAKVVITEAMHPVAAEIVTSAGHEVIMLPNSDESLHEEYIRNADAIINRLFPMTREVIRNAGSLRIISRHGVGVDNVDLDAAKEHGIAVTITPGANAQAVAEHTAALMLSLAKCIVPVSAEYYKRGFSVKNEYTAIELAGKTLGLIGCGRIGSILAKICANGFGMKVLVYDPYAKTLPDGCEPVQSPDEIYKNADFISLHCFLSDETRGMINERAFSFMKPTAILINCARGPLVDENALLKALEEKKIFGAGLDATCEEPLPKDHPFFTMENVICTPHFAPCTSETSYNVAKMAAENVVNFLAGKPVVGRLV